MALCHSTSLYISLPSALYSIYYTLLHSIMALHSTSAYHGSTSFYFTLPWLHYTLLDLTSLYHDSNSLTMPYFTLLQYAMALLHATWLYITVLESTSFYHGFTSLYPGITWLYFTLLHNTMALRHYLILVHSTMALLHSTAFYLTLHFDAAISLDST